MRNNTQHFQTFPFTYLIKDAKIPERSGLIICIPKLMGSPYETKIILLLKATTLAGALAARHECPGARPFPSAPTQRLFLGLATREVLIGGLPVGERDHRCGDPAPTGTPPRWKRAPGPCTAKRR